MQNEIFDTYKYTKKTKTSYKLVVSDTGDTQTNLSNTLYLSNACYIKSKSNIKPCYSLGESKKHLTSLYQFYNNEIDYFYGDIKKENKRYLLIAKIIENDLIVYVFKNEYSITDKLKSLEIVKNEIA